MDGLCRLWFSDGGYNNDETGWEGRNEMTHQHEYIQANVAAHNQLDGSGRLLSVTEYCDCGQVRELAQSASSCDWSETLPQARIILDEDGTPLGTAWL